VRIKITLLKLKSVKVVIKTSSF